jgi:hypothetical protein
MHERARVTFLKGDRCVRRTPRFVKFGEYRSTTVGTGDIRSYERIPPSNTTSRPTLKVRRDILLHEESHSIATGFDGSYFLPWTHIYLSVVREKRRGADDVGNSNDH